MDDTFKFRSFNGIHRGKRYKFEDFKVRYGLDASQARDLFERFGPSAIELDLLMAAKQRRTPGVQASLK